MTTLGELRKAVLATSLDDDTPVFVKIPGQPAMIEIDMIVAHNADVKIRNKLVLIVERIEL